jgi:hypothetical protein
MKDSLLKKGIVISTTILLIISSCITAAGIQIKNKSVQHKEINERQITTTEYITKYIELNLTFSTPEIVAYNNYSVVRVNQTNHNQIEMFDYDPGKPVLPVNISIFNLPFGSKILDVEYEHSEPVIYELPGKIAFCKAKADDGSFSIDKMDLEVYESNDPYPMDWTVYHAGGGLLQSNHTTFLVLRVYPVRYFPVEDNVQFIQSISLTISYEEPIEPILDDPEIYDFLIISPKEFSKHLTPLVNHKEQNGVKTKLVTLDTVYEEMYWDGRDKAEKIKYFIKNAIENWGISHVMLVGGIKGQGTTWSLPARYSYVVPLEEQEYPEQRFLSDLYFADIYDSEGEFCSWDSDNDDQFSVWNETIKDEMDLYPDVYLGRIPCRNILEVIIMVNKIIKYETGKVAEKDWFKNLLLVAGDSYINNGQWPKEVEVNEGELATETALDLMPGFTPLRVYASEDDINRKTVNKAFNQGAGFAYFCGHGSKISWSTHFPPATNDSNNWTTGYRVLGMIPLHNREKLPITVVGGCHNGEFDISVKNSIITGLKERGLAYFYPKGQSFWWSGWATNCWAWWLTSKIGGGAIATIANTGLGTHGDGDQDNNSIADYLEILDGWLELRFLEMYGTKGRFDLGENHGDTLTGYLQRFMDDGHKMDVKMVQQWELFGDPSLKIGGYSLD